MNSSDMCVKASFHTKGTIANLALMWLQFFMNQLDEPFDIWCVKTFFTDITLAHFLGGWKFGQIYGYCQKAILYHWLILMHMSCWVLILYLTQEILIYTSCYREINVMMLRTNSTLFISYVFKTFYKAGKSEDKVN